MIIVDPINQPHTKYFSFCYQNDSFNTFGFMICLPLRSLPNITQPNPPDPPQPMWPSIPLRHISPHGSNIQKNCQQVPSWSTALKPHYMDYSVCKYWYFKWVDSCYLSRSLKRGSKSDLSLFQITVIHHNGLVFMRKIWTGLSL